MTSIILHGVKITIGSKVRYINDKDLYTFDTTGQIIRPKLGYVYTVRGFTSKLGFFLKEIINDPWEWMKDGKVDTVDEPGFASWRFEPYKPKSGAVKIDCEFPEIVEERLDVPSKVF